MQTTDSPPTSGPIYVPAEQRIPAEALDERLRRLENLLVQRYPGPPPDGLTPNTLMPLASTTETGESAKRSLGEMPVMREIKLIAQMYLDPRYRLSRLAQFGVPGMLIACLLNYLLFNYLLIQIPFLTHVVERLILIVLGITLYLILRNETLRYRNVLDYLSQVGRPT